MCVFVVVCVGTKHKGRPKLARSLFATYTQHTDKVGMMGGTIYNLHISMLQRKMKRLECVGLRIARWSREDCVCTVFFFAIVFVAFAVHELKSAQLRKNQFSNVLRALFKKMIARMV